MTEAVLRVRVDGKGAEAQVRRLDTNFDRAAKSGGRLEKSARGVGGAAQFMRRAIAGLGLGLLIRDTIKVSNEFIGFENALTAVTGSLGQARREMAFIANESDRIGIGIRGATRDFTLLSASAKGTILEGRQIRDIYSGIAESMRVLNRTEAETTGAFLALSQSISKGKVTAEELRQQLAERLPGAVQIMARALGVGTEELDKMLEKGEVGIDVLPLFAAEVKKMAAAGLELAQASPSAEFARLNNEIIKAKNELGQGFLLPFLAELSRDLRGVLQDVVGFIRDDLSNALDFIGEKFGAWGELVDRVFGRIQEGGPKTIQIFKDSFGTILDFLSDLPDIADFVWGVFFELAGHAFENISDSWEILKLRLQQGFNAIETFGGKAWMFLRLGFAEMADSVISDFQDILNNLATGFVLLGPLGAEMASQLFAAAGALDKFADSAVIVEGELDAFIAKQAEIVFGIDAEIAALQKQIMLRKFATADQIIGLEKELAGKIASRKRTSELVGELEKLRKVTKAVGTETDTEAEAQARAAAAESKHTKEAKALAKALQAIEDRLDPAVELTREFEKELDLLVLRFEALTIAGESTERVVELMGLLKLEFRENIEQAAGLEEAVDPFAEAWIGALERIDEAFAGAWRGAFDSFKAFASSIKEAFLTLLAELAHLAITRPILMQLGIGGAGAGGGGAGALAGLGGLQSLGAGAVGLGVSAATGSTGAGIGAGLGLAGVLSSSAIASFAATNLGGAALSNILGIGFQAAIPIVGIFIGAAVGALLEGIFGQDNPLPRIALVNNQTPAGSPFRSEFSRDSAFGLTIAGQQITGLGGDGGLGAEAAQQFLDAVQGFDQSVADLLNPEQIAAVRSALLGPSGESRTLFEGDISVSEALSGRLDTILSALDPAIAEFVEGIGGSLEDRLNSFQIALNLQDIVDTTTLFENLGQALNFISDIPGDPVEVIETLLELTAAIQQQFDVLEAFSDSGLATDYAEALELASRTMGEQLSFIDQAISELINGDDITAQTVGEVTNLVVARYQLELQMLAQIDGAIRNIGLTIDRAVQSIFLTTLDTEGQFNFFRAEAERLANEVLPNLTDPAQIEAVTAQIVDLSNRAFGLLGPEEQAIRAGEFIDFLEGVRSLSLDLLSGVREQVLSDAQITRDLISDFMTALPEPLILAANSLIAAANALNPENPTEPVASPGTNPPPGGGIPSPPNTTRPRGSNSQTSSNKDIVDKLTENNSKLEVLVVTLTNELVANTRALSRNDLAIAEGLRAVATSRDPTSRSTDVARR